MVYPFFNKNELISNILDNIGYFEDCSGKLFVNANEESTNWLLK